MDNLKKLIKKAKLKYNIFSTSHPREKLRGKLFKFINEGSIQLLKTKEVILISKKDLYSGNKKLYFPADMS